MGVERLRPDQIPDVYHFIEAGTKEGLLPRSLKEITEIADNFFVYRLEEADAIIGCVSLEVYSPRLAEIRSLYVVPAARGGKIASQLIQACIKEAVRRDVREIIAITERIDLFERAGFDNPLDKQRALFLKLK